MSDESVSQPEIKVLARKLDEFAAGLPPRDQSILRLILARAAADPLDDVEGHGLARMSIAALVLAAAGTLGVANASAGQVHHPAPAVSQVHHVVSVVGDDKGGSETITYTTNGTNTP